MSPRIVFLCKQRLDNYGYLTSSGLLNSARMVVETLRENGLSANLVDCVDGNDIDRVVTEYGATHAILEAFWVTPEKLEELAKLHPKIHWAIRNHSKSVFLVSEGIGFPWAIAYCRLGKKYNIKLAPNSRAFADEFRDALGFKTTFLPNIYRPANAVPRRGGITPFLHVGSFGAVRLLKNQITQALAAMAWANAANLRIAFHINASRQEQMGSEVLKGLRAIFAGTPHGLVEHPWVSHAEFQRMVVQMDIVLQVSLTETFNIVLADAVTQGVPIVGSAEIPWLPARYVADPTDYASIVCAMVRALEDGPRGVRKCRQALAADTEKARGLWLGYFGITKAPGFLRRLWSARR